MAGQLNAHGGLLLATLETPRRVGALPRAGTLLFACLVSLAAPGFSALACTIATEPYSSFDPAEYVFYGEVTGYTSSQRHCAEGSLRVCETSWGLVLRILEPIHLPSRDVREVELYSFGLESDCSRIVVSESEARQTPIGALMAVVAKELEESQPRPGRDRIALENWVGSVAFRMPAESRLSELARARFDYSSFDPAPAQDIRNFELRRDMLRLQNARSEAAVLEVLFRLLEWGLDPEEQDSAVRRIARKHLKSSSGRKQLESRIAESIALLDDSEPERQLNAALKRAREGSALHELLSGLMLIEQEEPAAALGWMKRSARHGFYPAYLHVGDFYNALHQDAEDEQKAAAYEQSSQEAYRSAATEARKAVSENEPLGFLVLGELYERGLAGLPQDARQAEELYCRFLEYPVGWYPMTRLSPPDHRCGVNK
jgi:hypothetical protein